MSDAARKDLHALEDALPPGEELQKPAEDIMVVDDDTDETLLDLEDLGGEETGASDETSVPSLEMNEEEANAETVTEELVFDEDKSGKGNETCASRST